MSKFAPYALNTADISSTHYGRTPRSPAAAASEMIFPEMHRAAVVGVGAGDPLVH